MRLGRDCWHEQPWVYEIGSGWLTAAKRRLSGARPLTTLYLPERQCRERMRDELAAVGGSTYALGFLGMRRIRLLVYLVVVPPPLNAR